MGTHCEAALTWALTGQVAMTALDGKHWVLSRLPARSRGLASFQLTRLGAFTGHCQRVRSAAKGVQQELGVAIRNATLSIFG